MQYLAYFVCNIIAFVCWIITYDARQWQEQDAVHVFFETVATKIKRICTTIDKVLRSLFPHAYKDDEEEIKSDRKLKWAPNPRSRRQSTFMPLAVHRKPVGQKADKTKALQKHSSGGGGPVIIVKKSK